MKTKTLKAIIPVIFLVSSTFAEGATSKLPSTPKIPTPKSMDEVFTETEKLKTQMDVALNTALQKNDQKNQERVSRFFSLALEAWNPSLNPNDIQRIVDRHIENAGLLKGLIEPALALIDMSYAAGKPSFGNLLNPMIRELAPNLANQLHDKYQLPLDYHGQSFDRIAGLSNKQIFSVMSNILGTGNQFYQDVKHEQIDTNADYLPQALLGNSSFIKYTAQNSYPNQMHREDDSGFPQNKNPNQTSTPRYSNDIDDGKATYNPQHNGVSTPRVQGDNLDEKPHGLFSKTDVLAYGSCFHECAVDVINLGGSSGTAGAFIGGSIGVVVGTLVGGVGAVPGGTAGGFVGGGIGAITGGIIAGTNCSHLKSCGGDGDSQPHTTPPPPPTSTPTPPEHNDPPKPKEPETTDPQPETPPADDGGGKDGNVTPPAPKDPDSDDNGPSTSDDDTERRIKGNILVRFNQDEMPQTMGIPPFKIKNIGTPMISEH